MENNLKEIYVYKTKSFCCTPETNTVLCINYILIKKRKDNLLYL